MTTNPIAPVDRLLQRDSDREAAVRELGRCLEGLAAAVAAYRAAWKTATKHGWARADLKRAGFIDAASLPRSAASADSPRTALPVTD